MNLGDRLDADEPPVQGFRGKKLGTIHLLEYRRMDETRVNRLVGRG
jgi:hypothetical protein